MDADDRAPDRPSRVVHQIVDVSEPAEDVFDRGLDGRRVGDVACECVRLSALGPDAVDEFIERIGVARQGEYRRAAFGDGDGRRTSDTAGGAGDDHVLTHQRSRRIVAARPIGVEVLGPVAPQLGGVRRELRHRDAGAAQRFFRIVGCEGREQVDDVEDFGRHSELSGGHVAKDLGASGGPHDRRRGAAWQGPAQWRQTGGLGYPSVNAPQPNRFRRRQMEGLPVATLGVHQCDERVDHEVDRNDVGAPGVGQHHRREPGQSGQLGQHPEEVVGPVDLVHLTGARVADDDRRPIDAVLQPLR